MPKHKIKFGTLQETKRKSTVNSDELEEWIVENYTCEHCGKVCRTWDSMKRFDSKDNIVYRECPKAGVLDA